MKKKTFNFIELALYYIVVFLILQEWLVPIMQLTKTGHMQYILGFIALCLVTNLFNIYFVISWIVKLIYICWFIVYVYSGLSVFSLKGMQFLIYEMQYNMITLFSGDWLNITDPFRTLLFFILIWMLIYLIHHWITTRATIFYFLVLTIFFIATLDTFTEYDGSYAIVKVVLLGLLMTVFLYIKKLMNQSGISFQWYKYFVLIIPAIIFIGLSSIVAIALPKSEPQWPDPVPYIKAATGQGEGEGTGNAISKVGYGTNDSNLGGAFIPDDTVVFIAEAESKQYWRVETKDLYTGTGWEQSVFAPNESAYFDVQDEIQYSLPKGPVEDAMVATITQVNPFDFIFQPYGLKKVNIQNAQIADYEDIGFLMNINSEKIYPYADGQILTLANYSVEYSKPTYLYSELQKSAMEDIDTESFERYLQLPENLPSRVKELAQEIVADSETAYQKARAIETYFSSNGFRYETQNVAVPEDGQDYVDQFLFETKVGYCDNFSTSMVVLLRSVGIPARWVKGFAGGEIVHSSGELKTYEITNNNAHSWVEAYIPNVGWVNFEPTIGFSNMRSIEYDTQIENIEDELEIQEEETQEVIREEEEEDRDATSQNNTNFFEEFIDMINKNHVLFYIINASILLAGFLLILSRRKWLPKVYIQLNRRKPMNELSFETMFTQLLRVLEMRGIKRKEDQTLKSFAQLVDKTFGTNDMTKITNVYERYIYGDNEKDIDFGKLRESWEFLINRSSS